jgi:DNA-binding MarR family transcriptional regulator
MDKPLGYGEIEKSPAFQLWQATNAWGRLVHRALEPFGLTHVQLIMLASIQILAEREPTVTQAMVSRFASTDENMTSQVVRTLEKKGYLNRVPCESDKRAFRLDLSEAGEDLTSRAREAVKAESKLFFEPLGSDSELLARLLSRLQPGLER